MTYTNETIGILMDNLCDTYKEHEAIVFPEENIHYTYAEFKSLYYNIAKSLLSLGVKKGDRVAIWALNYPESIALQIAVGKIGAVLVWLNSNYKKSELEYTLEHSDSTTLFLSKGYKNQESLDILLQVCPELLTCKKGNLTSTNLPKLKNIILLNDMEDDTEKYSNHIYFLRELFNDNKDITDQYLSEIEQTITLAELLNIQYTSGTTGHPKAVMLDQYAIIKNALVTGEQFKYSSDDKLLTCLPLYHVMGCVLSAITCLLFGATVVLVKKFNTTTVLTYIESEKCTALNAVPTMFKYLLNSDQFDNYDLTSLNKGMIAGSLCPNQILAQIIDRMNIHELTIVYGQTEALAVTANLLTSSNDKKINTIGSVLPGVLIKIVDINTGEELPNGMEGEICIKSPYNMQGYYKNEEATNRTIDCDGWLHTGDLASKDNQGLFKITERIKDIIIRGGENISPAEIELVLDSHEAIKESSIVGLPDKDLGEEVCSFIILNDGYSIELSEIQKYVAENLANYKVPKYIEIIKEFPTTANGKIKKFQLKELAIKKYRLA